MQYLPKELFHEIAKHCTVTSLVALGMVCRPCTSILADNKLWCTVIETRYPIAYSSLIDFPGHESKYPSRWDWSSKATTHKQFFFYLSSNLLAKNSTLPKTYDRSGDYPEHLQIYDLVRRHPTNPRLIAVSFYALKRMMYREKHNQFDIEEDLLRVGAAEFIVNLVIKYASNAIGYKGSALLSSEAFGMLGNMATLGKIREYLSKTNIHAWLVHALRKYPRVEALQRDALFFAFNLCIRQEREHKEYVINTSKLIQAGIISCVLVALRGAARENREIQDDVFKIVTHMFNRSEHCCNEFISGGGLTMITEILKTYIDDGQDVPSVLYPGLYFLASRVGNQRLRHTIMPLLVVMNPPATVEKKLKLLWREILNLLDLQQPEIDDRSAILRGDRD